MDYRTRHKLTGQAFKKLVAQVDGVQLNHDEADALLTTLQNIGEGNWYERIDCDEIDWFYLWMLERPARKMHYEGQRLIAPQPYWNSNKR